MPSELRAALPAALQCLLLQGVIVSAALGLQAWVLPTSALPAPAGPGSVPVPLQPAPLLRSSTGS